MLSLVGLLTSLRTEKPWCSFFELKSAEISDIIEDIFCKKLFDVVHLFGKEEKKTLIVSLYPYCDLMPEESIHFRSLTSSLCK
jgi:hypothetical protein